jgi:ectoine hydroxylase-related dioxygenase (phytanoyl-CoA dioxygenase family)
MTMTLPISVDFDRFNDSDVRGWFGEGRGRAGAAVVGLGRSITFRVDGREWTYRSTGADLELIEGGVGGFTAELDAAAFSDLVNEMWSVFGLLYSDRVTLENGNFGHFASWEPALQALWFGRPIYGPDTVDALVDRNGGPLDLARSFALDDDPDEMAHFLQTCGYLVVRGVFERSETDVMNAIVAREKATASPDDNRSWWATDIDGNEVCCRLTYLAQRDRVFGELVDDERLLRLARLSGAELLPCADRVDGMGVVIKNPSITAGLSDLPWHRDCGMGGHFVLCPGLNVGIQLDRADADNGQLWFLAGSHRHAAQALEMSEIEGLPAVPVETEPGDVTIHFGHVLHAAPAPLSPAANRKAVYVGFHAPGLFDVVGPGEAYNDVLFAHGDGRVRSVADVEE